MINTILIANRGEIACRVIETARALGLTTVAVFAEPDRFAKHVQRADQAIFIGEAPVQASYLNQATILRAAQDAGADAIHPGYGFCLNTPILPVHVQNKASYLSVRLGKTFIPWATKSKLNY